MAVETTMRRGLAKVLGTMGPRTSLLLSGRPPVIADGQQLDPGLQLFLRVQQLMGERDYASQTHVEVRRNLRNSVASGVRAGTPPMFTRDLLIAGADGRIPARLYTPDEVQGRNDSALLVYFHGGGFVAGGIDTHDGPCRLLAHHSGVKVLSVEYRLAPEFPFPAGAEDAISAFGWAVDHAHDLRVDPARIAVGGDSAGANLATVVALATRDRALTQPMAQLLLYPTTDTRHPGYSLRLFGDGYFLTTGQISWYGDRYLLPADVDTDDTRANPLRAEDLSGLAPATVVTAGFDPLRDEGELYAAALLKAGTPTLLRRFPSLIHGFMHYAWVNETSRLASVEVAGLLRAAVNPVQSRQP